MQKGRKGTVLAGLLKISVHRKYLELTVAQMKGKSSKSDQISRTWKVRPEVTVRWSGGRLTRNTSFLCGSHRLRGWERSALYGRPGHTPLVGHVSILEVQILFPQNDHQGRGPRLLGGRPCATPHSLRGKITQLPCLNCSHGESLESFSLERAWGRLYHWGHFMRDAGKWISPGTLPATLKENLAN